MKKFLTLLLTVALTATLAITGTVAYLTDTDSDVNVMTMGSVQIVQHEKERVDMTQQSKDTAAVLQDFTQGQPLYPAVLNMTGHAANDQQCWAPGGASGALEDHYVNWGDFVTADVATGSSAWNGVWGTSLKNVIDKFVFVENTGKSDAYYRTIILLEADETNTQNSFNQDMIHYNYNGNGLFSWTHDIGNVTVNGEVYNAIAATYTEPLKPGTVSRPSFLQVGLDGEATNEIVAQFGNTYDILVLSQAVQTEGFVDANAALTAGFGELTPANIATWFGDVSEPAPTFVATAAELQAALDAEATNIIVTADITGDVVINQPGNDTYEVTIDGNHYKYDGTIKIKGNSDFDGDDKIVIKNFNFETSTADTDFIWSADSSNGSTWRYAHNVTIEDCTFTATGAAVNTAVGARFQQAYNITVKGCTATNVHSLLQAESCGSTVIVDGCKVVNGKNGVSLNNTMNAIVKNCEIESVVDGGYGIRHKGQVNNYALTVENCTVDAFVPVLIRNMTGTGYTADFVGTNTLTATNTFGYQVVLSAGDWDNDVAKPSAPTGSYTITGVDAFNVFEG